MIDRFPHLAQRLFNRPLAIHPEKAEIIVAALAQRLGIAQISRPQMMEEDDLPPAGVAGSFGGPGATPPRVGYEIVQGAAIITISGTLVHKLGTLRPYSGMTGYDGIRQNVLTAMADPDVKGVFLDIDTPGGECAGCFDLVDTLFELRDVKPIWACVNEQATSAGQAIASAAERVITPRTGVVGSVGVIVLHVDMSDALDKSGMKVTIVTFGDRKADGNPYERLSRDVKSRIQADIDTLGALFIDTISRNMGISANSVRDMQAACYLGEEGVAQGLAHEVMAADEAFAEFVESL